VADAVRHAADAADAVGDAAHAGARVFDELYGRAVYDVLNDGDILSVDEVLDAGRRFVGNAPNEPAPGVFVSRQPVDGTDVHAMFRITDADLRPGPHHAGGVPHANLQLVHRRVAPGTGRATYAPIDGENKHIFIIDP
jgi:hypothetical protein